MQKNKNMILVGSLVVIVLVLLFLYAGKNSSITPGENLSGVEVSSSTEIKNPTASSTATKPSSGTGGTNLITGSVPGYYSYANAPYNFKIQYPAGIQPLTSFATFHELGNNWRLYAGQANQGQPVVSFSVKNIDQGTYFTGKQTYPLYFSAEVRIGVSPNTKDCYLSDAGYTNQKITNVTINGVPFKKFSTSDGATMKYVQAESYRTVRNNTCYVIEQIQNGSKYRDEKMSTAFTDAQLTNYYNLGEKIVKTFVFTK